MLLTLPPQQRQAARRLRYLLLLRIWQQMMQLARGKRGQRMAARSHAAARWADGGHALRHLCLAPCHPCDPLRRAVEVQQRLMSTAATRREKGKREKMSSTWLRAA
jgi:hypothetical protein